METHFSMIKLDAIRIFLFSLCLMLYQTLLTRVFSVVLGNHLAFFSVSLAMLGLTIGALIVGMLGKETCQKYYSIFLSNAALILSITILIIIPHILYVIEPLQTLPLIIGYCILYSFPMILCSFLVSLILLKNSHHFGKLYSWDLAGAALGCLVFAFLLQYLDPFSIFLAIATIGVILGALTTQKTKWLYLILIIVCGSMLIFQVITSLERKPWLGITKSKTKNEVGTLFERWNAFSRVRVWEEKAELIGWGLSQKIPVIKIPKELGLNIDGSAYTVITAFDGNLDKVSFLKFDLTNLVHYLKHNASVFIVGVGGGRDILSSLVFDQSSIHGAELNPAIFEVLNERFADFSGHLLQNPRVKVINNEARTYLASSKQLFDIIEISLVDTWAATASGAFALSENGLYTLEGFNLFFNHLSPDGILSVSRWYPDQSYNEIQKLLVLATQSLMNLGVIHPQEHMYLARSSAKGVGTLLLKKTAFLPQEIIKLDQVVNELGFETKISPLMVSDPQLASLIDPKKIFKEVASRNFNIEAPNDNRPFFFMFEKQLNFIDIFHTMLLGQLLLATLIISLIILIILGYVKSKSGILFNKNMGKLLSYVSLIGLGFMFIEISLLQRLGLFLGHPTYALTVTLFSLLLSVSLGSYLTSYFPNFISWRKMILLSIPLILLLHFMLFNRWNASLIGTDISLKIAYVIALIFPIGILLGMPMPLAIAIVNRNYMDTQDIFWTVNGLASAIGSILAVIICIFGGISLAFKLGMGLYLLSIFFI